MIRRLLKPSNSNSLFLFGARGTGKTTLIEALFPASAETLSINFLTESDENEFGRRPDNLSAVLTTKAYKRVIIDEVQKFPKILDIVHHEIQRRRGLQFILTGSSARKLRRGGANLLAGRAFVYHLYPMTHRELAHHFDLNESLHYGDLPIVRMTQSHEDQIEYLRSYVRSYLREEIAIEQIVRKIDPFRDFLEIAAQSNGKIINFNKIARAVGISDRTIQSYYSILEDTLMGFFLPSFNRSVRRRQRVSPKFYFFDLGIKRSIEKTLNVPLLPQTYAYGDAFEHYLIKEAISLNEYCRSDYKFSYLRTKDDAEVDLVIERPGQCDLLVEIKSSQSLSEDDFRSINAFAESWDRKCEAQIWSCDVHKKKHGCSVGLHWREALAQLFVSEVQKP